MSMSMAGEDPRDDEPLTLSDACQLIFKNKISPASLRAEALRGRLVIERIGRRDFVTRAAIREMREKCRLAPPLKAPASGFSPPVSEKTAAPPSLPSGSSATMADSSIPLDALLLTVEKLSAPSPATSRNGTGRRGGKVIPLRS